MSVEACVRRTSAISVATRAHESGQIDIRSGQIATEAFCAFPPPSSQRLR
jgi:hypothetical protein